MRLFGFGCWEAAAKLPQKGPALLLWSLGVPVGDCRVNPDQPAQPLVPRPRGLEFEEGDAAVIPVHALCLKRSRCAFLSRRLH